MTTQTTGRRRSGGGDGTRVSAWPACGIHYGKQIYCLKPMGHHGDHEADEFAWDRHLHDVLPEAKRWEP